MKALTFRGPKDIHFESVVDPGLEESSDVLIRVQNAAICGSDLHVYRGHEHGPDSGTVMGHEFMGEIVECGKDVRKFRKGELVFSPFSTSCGACYYCKINLPCRCVQGQLYGWRQGGRGLQGVQAEFARVPLADSTLLKIPEGVSSEDALLLGDVYSTGYYCADMAEIKPGNVVAVIGCGPVGLMAIVGARELGAGAVFAIDTVPERLDLAKVFGATPLYLNQEIALDVLHNATEGRGADAVLEAVGSPDATRTAYELVRPGGIISAVGVHTEEHFSFSPGEAYDKNITYKAGRCPARHYMEKLLPVIQSQKYDVSRVVSHRLPLQEGVQGYKIFDEKLQHCTKIVLQC